MHLIKLEHPTTMPATWCIFISHRKVLSQDRKDNFSTFHPVNQTQSHSTVKNLHLVLGLAE